MRIDLNVDTGEAFGAWTIADDAAVLTAVSSANIACGFHAGDPSTMRRTVALARDLGVAVGAHPGYPDLVGFGRRTLDVAPRELEDLVLYQVAALAGIARAEGTTVRHVKAHGALYNRAWQHAPTADAIARAVARADPALLLFAPHGSLLMEAGRNAGLRCVAEGFIDRAYSADGLLVSRHIAGSVLDDVEAMVERALRFVEQQSVVTVAGTTLPMPVGTLCIHGDNPRAPGVAKAVKAALTARGIEILAPLTDS